MEPAAGGASGVSRLCSSGGRSEEKNNPPSENTAKAAIAAMANKSPAVRINPRKRGLRFMVPGLSSTELLRLFAACEQWQGRLVHWLTLWVLQFFQGQWRQV